MANLGIRHKLLSTTVASASWLPLFGMLQPALAQAQAADQESQEGEAAVEEIVITGSRIQRGNLTMPVPVTTIDAEDIIRSGETDIAEILAETPALLNSPTTDTSNIFGDGLGTATLNSRQLGTERTLVLVNGRRFVPGIVGEATVDINAIPTSLVERVDVLTGGASAIYGADAVTGVVNFVLKEDFEGISARSQFRIADEGDRENWFTAITAGGNFADGRGNAWISVELDRQQEVNTQDRRNAGGGPVFNFNRGIQRGEQAGEVTNTPEVSDFFGTNPDAPITFQPNETFAISSAAGKIDIHLANFTLLGIGPNGEPIAGSDGLFFNGPGTLRNFDLGLPAGGTNGIGGDGIPNITNVGTSVPESDQININTGSRYEFMPELTWFMETNFSFTDTQSIGGVNTFNDFIPIQADNPFIPQEIRSLLDAAAASGDPAFANINPDFFDGAAIVITRDQLDEATRNTADRDRLTARIVTGFEGQIGSTWDYEISFNYGRTEVDIESSRSRVEDRFFAAVDAVALTEEDIANLGPDDAVQALREGVEGAITVTGRDAQVGDIVCRSSIDPTAEPPLASFPSARPGFLTFDPGPGSPCVPTSIFGANVINPDAADFAFLPTTDNAELEQFVAQAIVTGSTEGFFELPYGPIDLAGGFEWRREESRFEPDNLDRLDLVFAGGTQPSAGAFNVKEWFAEASAPLVQNEFLLHDLRIDGAARISDFTTTGTEFTWKYSGTWAPTQDIRFRGSRSRTVRAPNIDELFSPQQVAFFFPDDPCDEDFIDLGTEFREQNCRALGIPEGFNDPNTARFEGVSGGNPNLDAEESDAFTVGAVITPRWLPGFVATVDYWDVEVDDAISTIGAQEIVDNCVDAPTIDNEFCDLLRRDPETLGLSFIEQTEQNVSSFRAKGVDFTVRYQLEMADVGLPEWGSLNFSVVGTKLTGRKDFQFQRFPDEFTREKGTFFNPDWNVNLQTTWQWRALSLNYQLRFQSSQLMNGIDFEEKAFFEENNPGVPLADPLRTGNSFVHDINFSYQLFDTLSVNGGVNNVGDRDPFRAGALAAPVSVVGRTFFAGVSFDY